MIQQLGRLVRLLDAVYPEPQALASTEEFARAHHDDLPQLLLESLDAERILGRLRWAAIIHHGGRPSEWLEERLARLDQAAARLRERARR